MWCTSYHPFNPFKSYKSNSTKKYPLSIKPIFSVYFLIRTSDFFICNTIRKPCNAIRKPCNAIRKPCNAIRKPCNAIRKPCNAIRKPCNAIRKPCNAIRKPCNAVCKPRNAISKLCISFQKQNIGNREYPLSIAVFFLLKMSLFFPKRQIIRIQLSRKNGFLRIIFGFFFRQLMRPCGAVFRLETCASALIFSEIRCFSGFGPVPIVPTCFDDVIAHLAINKNGFGVIAPRSPLPSLATVKSCWILRACAVFFKGLRPIKNNRSKR